MNGKPENFNFEMRLVQNKTDELLLELRETLRVAQASRSYYFI